MNILISQPNLYNYNLFLPYIWACLKTHCDRDPRLAKECRWLEPIFYNDDPHELLEPYQDVPIHVLGLSCYTWNFDLNLRIAKRVKALHPNCLVVAGGPDPDMRDKEFFGKYPEIDVVVRQDGEIPFSQILTKHLDGDDDFTAIPGLMLPAGEGRPPVHTVVMSLLRDFHTSPYLEQGEFFATVIQRHLRRFPGSRIRMFWETNRGCPYSCAFCDWGSNTTSNVRAFPMERISREIDWIAEKQIEFVLITDANFGMLPRDVGIARKFIEVKARTGFPGQVHYTVAKNNVKRVVDITVMLYAAGLVKYHTMSIQHTDPAVIQAMDRQNLPIENQLEIVRRLKNHDIPIVAQVIFGSPGDDFPKWQKCLTDLMEWGIHDEYKPYAYNLLPNAPAANPTYLEKWRMQSAPRYTYMNRRKKNIARMTLSKTPYVIATATYSQGDWVDMYVFSAFIQSFHNGGLTRLLSQFLRTACAIRYQDFYSGLWEALSATKGFVKEHLEHARDHIKNFVNDEEAFEEMAIASLPSSSCYYRQEDYLLFHFLSRQGQFWDAVTDILEEKYGHLPHYESVVAFQKSVLITPDYDCQTGRLVRSMRNWPEFFRQLDAENREGAASILAETPGGYHFQFVDTACGVHKEFPLDWWDYPAKTDAWYQRYIDQVIGVDYYKARRTYLSELRTEIAR